MDKRLEEVLVALVGPKSTVHSARSTVRGPQCAVHSAQSVVLGAAINRTYFQVTYISSDNHPIDHTHLFMSVPIASKIGESESAEEFDALRATSDVSNVSGVGADEAANQAPVGPVRVNKHCTSPLV